jgi:hypothetical protein
MNHPEIGEQIVGAYLRVIKKCQFVTYNRRTPGDGNQPETDVVAIKSEDGKETVYGCEVVTHLDGPNYSTNKNTNDWDDYSYASTLKKLEDKFDATHQLINQTWPQAEFEVLQFWSPYVPVGRSEKNLPAGLDELGRRIKSRHDVDVDMIYNSKYASRITDELQTKASRTTSSHDEPAFRFLQILENIHD